MTWTRTASVIPMGAPRMTRRDRWKRRPIVLRYFAFRDALRAECAGHPIDPHEVSWVAYMQFPNSYTKARRERLRGQPHQTKPDRDNIDKAVLDTLFPDDSRVSDGHLRKVWDDGNGPRIEITMEY